jgi:hypothetical protein
MLCIGSSAYFYISVNRSSCNCPFTLRNLPLDFSRPPPPATPPNNRRICFLVIRKPAWAGQYLRYVQIHHGVDVHPPSLHTIP